MDYAIREPIQELHDKANRRLIKLVMPDIRSSLKTVQSICLMESGECMGQFTGYLFRKLEKNENCYNGFEINGAFKEAVRTIDP